MPREVARVSATAIIWTAIALLFGFLLLGKTTTGPFEMVLGIIIIVCGFVSTAAVWEQLSDSSVHVHLTEADHTSSHYQKRKGPLKEDQIRRLADSLDADSAATLLAALQERDGSDGEYLTLERLMDEDSHS